MTELLDWQFELDGLVFGQGTSFRVLAGSLAVAKPEIRQFDSPLPRADGMRFSRHYLAGGMLPFEVGVEGSDPEQVLDRFGQLRSVWDGSPTRTEPGDVLPLRMRRPGRTVRVYGRPGRFEAASMANASTGWVPVVCDFQAVDHLYYADTLASSSVSIAPTPTGGFLFPMSFPASTSSTSDAAGEITVLGDAPTWLTITVHGPITNPVIDATSLWTLTLLISLADGEYVVVDSRSWSRHVTHNGLANVAGILTADSPRLSELRVPPGDQEIVLRGSSPTGGAWAAIEWRPAYTSF